MESNMLEVGKTVKVKQFTCTAATYDDIAVGDVGVVCDIDDSSELNHYVVFHRKGGLADWFNADELKVVE